jgi:TonB family protein
MRILAQLIIALLVPLPLAQGQDDQKLEYLFPNHIYGAEAKQLRNALTASPQIPISFENTDRSPLTIVGASVSAVRRYQSGESTLTPIAESEHAMDARITLVNKTARRTKSVKFVFTDVNLRKQFDLLSRIVVEPYNSSIFGEQRKDAPAFISLPMMPGQFSVKVLEVKFEDGTIWEVDSPDVDETPAPLTTPKSKHTEEALRNRIQGAVRMRLLVSEAGEVRKVKIIQGLPDGLDVEAVQTAYRLKFKPAMTAGKPVECWLLFEIDYKLPERPGLVEAVRPKP